LYLPAPAGNGVMQACGERVVSCRQKQHSRAPAGMLPGMSADQRGSVAHSLGVTVAQLHSVEVGPPTTFVPGNRSKPTAT
jgi:hypothetical protein